MSHPPPGKNKTVKKDGSEIWWVVSGSSSAVDAKVDRLILHPI